MTPIEMKQLQTEVHALAHAKGWYEDRDLQHLDTRKAMLALVHSELSEALECIRSGDIPERVLASGKPEGLGSELADVVIRMLDFAEAFDLAIEEHIPMVDLDDAKPLQAAARLFEMHGLVTRIGEQLVPADGDLFLVSECYDLAAAHGIDLDAAIRLKHAYNATRPHRHGGKSL